MKGITLVTLLLTAAAVGAVLWQLPQNLDQVVRFAEARPVVSAVLLVLWRVAAMVIPPLPGGTVAFALIPVFGWFQVYLYSQVGILAGASLAFWISRRFREPLTKRFVSLQRLHAWEDRFTPRTKLLGFLGFRFMTSPALDFVSYAAGLTKLSFRVFFVTTLLVELPSALVYYGSGEVYDLLSEHSRFLGVLALVGIGGGLSLIGVYLGSRHKH